MKSRSPSASSERVVTLSLPNLHPAQRKIKREARRFNVLNCGRRFGKDILGQELLFDTAIDGQPAAWFAPTFRMMLDTFREVARLVQPVAERTNASDHRIELITGGVIDMWSLDAADAARGHKYKRVIINEAAMAPRLEEAWKNVIRPTLADLEGDAFFLSTPRGPNFFKQLYMNGQHGDAPDWKSWTFPTAANPFIKASEIEAMRLNLTERAYRQEILADFIEGQGAVFRNVRAVCTQLQPDLPDAHAGHSFVMGVDWGKVNDYTRLRVLCRECMAVVDWDGFNKIDYTFQRERLKLLAERWGVSDILAESNSIGEPNIEELRRDNLPVRGFKTTAGTKPPLIEALSLAIQRGDVKLPAEDADELEAYEVRTNANTFASTYSAPDGAHDDRVMADALALWAATGGGTWWIL